MSAQACGCERKAKEAAEEEKKQYAELDRIIQAHNYCMEKGYCSIHDRDNISFLYDQYHNLGGNGTVTHLVECVNRLPTDQDTGAW